MNTLHYPGRIAPEDTDAAVALGPDQFQAFYVIKSVDYDEATDVTEVTLRPLPPAELMERNKKLLVRLGERARIRELFGVVS